MFIHCFPSGPFQTNAYLIGCEVSKDAAIIDPSPGSYLPIVKSLKENQLNIKKIILTHSHFDHIADVAEFKRHYDIPLFVEIEDAKNMEFPGSDGLVSPIPIEGVKPDLFLKEGENIKIGLLDFLVIHTPGHSPGGICLYNKENGVLFSGDTLFKGTIGNTSFPNSNPKKMWESLKKLAKLPKETIVYPGHGNKTTIGAEYWLESAEERFS